MNHTDLFAPRPDNPEIEQLRLRVMSLSLNGVTLGEMMVAEEQAPAPALKARPRRARRYCRLNDALTNTAAVHALAELGPVLPCIGKQPLLKNGVYGASQDPSTIDKWMERWPNCNIGLATGDIVVVDVDGQEGEQTWSALEDSIEALPDTLEVQTGRGRHLYFAANEHIGNSVGRIGPGVDVRGHGGYVIAPPSVHPDTGEQYRFADAQVELAEMPAWFAQLIS